MVGCRGQATAEEKKPRLEGLLHDQSESPGSSQRFHKSTAAREGEDCLNWHQLKN